MNKVLKGAGKSSQLVLYPDLDHQLRDDSARSDMLRKSYDFLTSTMK